MEKKVPISVVVVAKNEEKNIAACLESARWADEIVVLDNISSDRTVEIAKGYTDKVFQKGWEVDETRRNYAYSLASNDWILTIDAHETVSPELKDEIIDIFKKGPNYGIYTIPIRNYIGDYWIRHGGWYPAGKPRMFRKGSYKYEEEGYPKISFIGKSGYLKGDIIHYAFRDFGHFLAKLNHWTAQEAKKWIGKNKRVGLVGALRKGGTRFMKAYIVKKGYKDGFVGFMVATFAGFYQLMTYAKYWEIMKGRRK